MQLTHSNEKTNKSFSLKDIFKKKASLNTNLKAAKPFLKFSATNWLKECLFSPNHYFHVTTFINLASIMEKGLDPSYGGKNGASERVNFEDFIISSKGLVHAGKYTSTTGKYIDVFEKNSSESEWNCTFDVPTALKASAIVLRFSKNLESVEWDDDFDDFEGVTTCSRIEPKFIEALTTEGWVPISSLIEVANALKKSDKDN